MKTELPKAQSHIKSSDDRRMQILMAAARLFALHGFHATGMRQICEAVQLSPGALYRYFVGKDEIILGLIAWDRQRTTEWFSQLPMDQGLMACLEKLTELSRMDFAEDGFLAMWSEITAEAARNPSVRQHLQTHYRFVENMLADLITKARDAGDIRPDARPEDAAVFIMSGFEGLMVRRSVMPDFDFDHSSAQLLGFIADALGSRRPRKERRARL